MFLPIRCHVDVVLFGHEGHLSGVQSCESKHSNLLENVIPVTWCACQTPKEDAFWHENSVQEDKCYAPYLNLCTSIAFHARGFDQCCSEAQANGFQDPSVEKMLVKILIHT